jgi:hypothetical protein
LLHERIFIADRWNQGFLDCTGTGPADKVQKASGLVVRSRCPGTAKWLLAYNRPGGLIVYVEIACGVAELFHGKVNGLSVGCKNSTG